MVMDLLLVEDDDEEASLVTEALQGPPSDGPISLRRTATLHEALQALEKGRPDIILLDLSLPDSSGLDGLTRILAAEPAAVVVVRTGYRDDEVALKAVRGGAQDYLIKGEHSSSLLRRSLRHAIERGRAAREAIEKVAAHEVERHEKLIEAESMMLRDMRDLMPIPGGRAPFSPGIQIGARFVLQELIGEGASSHVYAAKDITTGHEVCVKHVRMGGSELAVKDLAREARLTALLVHPNVVSLLDFGSVWGEPYLVMELAKGGDVAKLLRHGPVPPARARAIMLDVLAGLAYIHSRSVLHLDLKPANVVFDAQGRAKITDFGIGLPASGRAWHETQTSLGGPQIFGTPAYVAPETLIGVPPSARSDVYSAGALLYHMLAGVPYLDLRGMDLPRMRRAIREERPSRDIPGGPIRDVALRALEKDSDARFASADEMRAALDAAAPPA